MAGALDLPQDCILLGGKSEIVATNTFAPASAYWRSNRKLARGGPRPGSLIWRDGAQEKCALSESIYRQPC
jgi:hypothetical protein